MMILTGLLILSIVAAILASFMAQRRNRDHNLWVLLAFIFPPFLLILWFLPKRAVAPRKLFAEEEHSEEFRPFKD